MHEMESSSWKRRGSSIVWSPELLRPLITEGDAVPLRAALAWTRSGFPESPPGDRATILVGGLQTVLDSIHEPESSYAWLRDNVLPLVQACGDHWDRVGLIFGMDGPGRMFTLNEADDLVYFGKGTDRDRKIKITRAIWNGAATGNGAYKLLDSAREVGGFHVQRVS
jgi:hypothetical protein